MKHKWRCRIVHTRQCSCSVAEPSNLMPPKSTCLLLDTKYSREDTKLHSSVEHTPRKNQKIHIFHQDHKWENKAYNIWPFLTSLLIQHQSIVFIIYNSGIWSCYQSYEQFRLTAEYKHVIRVTTEINTYSWHDEALIYKLWQQVIELPFIKIFSENYK